MGIYDRDYYRNESQGWFHPGGTSICARLIILNVLLFVAQIITKPADPGLIEVSPGVPMLDPGPVTSWLWMHTDKVLDGQVWRLLTSAFLHSTATPWHIIINMLILYFFGREIETVYGPREFLAMYLFAAVFANVFAMLVNLAGMRPDVPALGASGAISAVFILYAMHYPYRTIYLFFIIPGPAWLLALLFVAQDAFGLLSDSPEPIGYGAHLGGALFGFLYYRYHLRVLNWVPSLRWFRRTGRPKRANPNNLRIYSETTRPPASQSPEPVRSAVRAAPDPAADENLEAQLDAVLEKVARSGQDSLNEEERRILQRASEVYKKKRQ